jgi:hypothetical protein
MAVEVGETNEAKEETQRTDSGGVRDLLRKTVSNTVRSVGNDERVRQIVQSVVKEETVQAVLNSKMAKDAVGYAVRTLDSIKDEVVTMAGRQMNDFLERVDLGKELQKILTTLSLEVRAEVRFIPNDKRVVKPEVKSKMSIKRVPKEKREVSEKETKKKASSKRKAKSTEKTTRASTKTSAKTSTGAKAKTSTSAKTSNRRTKDKTSS